MTCLHAGTTGARSSPLDDDLDGLAASDLVGLRRRWRMVFGRSAPEHLSRSLLLRILTYRIQAEVFGELDRNTARALSRLHQTNGAETIPLAELRATKPGTLLVREWQGVLQRVMVLETGFAWNGVTYDSLSSVAKAITGTSWNGPKFFGLRERKPIGCRRPD